MKEFVKCMLNRLLIKVISIEGFIRILRMLRPTVDFAFKRLERYMAWPDIEYFVDRLPAEISMGVGGNCYTAWIYQQGFFAALIKCYAPHESLNILDFGCGYGKIAPISTFFTHPNGRYIGVDTRESNIDVCKRTYAHLPRVEFALSKDFNPSYTEQSEACSDKTMTYGQDWPVTKQSMDIVVAISVFTHLQEEDALGYIKRIYDILKPGGRAILTCHIVEEPRKRPRFTSPNKCRIDEVLEFASPLPPSHNWFTGTPDRPEDAIAFNNEALDRLIQGKFELKSFMRGSTTGGYDPFLQDIIILEKKV